MGVRHRRHAQQGTPQRVQHRPVLPGLGPVGDHQQVHADRRALVRQVAELVDGAVVETVREVVDDQQLLGGVQVRWQGFRGLVADRHLYEVHAPGQFAEHRGHALRAGGRRLAERARLQQRRQSGRRRAGRVDDVDGEFADRVGGQQAGGERDGRVDRPAPHLGRVERLGPVRAAAQTVEPFEAVEVEGAPERAVGRLRAGERLRTPAVDPQTAVHRQPYQHGNAQVGAFRQTQITEPHRRRVLLRRPVALPDGAAPGGEGRGQGGLDHLGFGGELGEIAVEHFAGLGREAGVLVVRGGTRRFGGRSHAVAGVGVDGVQFLRQAGLGEVHGAAVGGDRPRQVLEHAPDLVVEPLFRGPAGGVTGYRTGGARLAGRGCGGGGGRGRGRCGCGCGGCGRWCRWGALAGLRGRGTAFRVPVVDGAG